MWLVEVGIFCYEVVYMGLGFGVIEGEYWVELEFRVVVIMLLKWGNRLVVM